MSFKKRVRVPFGQSLGLQKKRGKVSQKKRKKRIKRKKEK